MKIIKILIEIRYIKKKIWILLSDWDLFHVIKKKKKKEIRLYGRSIHEETLCMWILCVWINTPLFERFNVIRLDYEFLARVRREREREIELDSAFHKENEKNTERSHICGSPSATLETISLYLLSIDFNDKFW